MRNLSRPERTYIIVIVVLLAVLCVKSLVLDEYQPKDDLESQVFTEYHQQSLSEHQSIFRVKRIVKIKPITEPDDLEHSIKYEYKIKIRHYMLGIIPYWETSDYVYN